MPAECAQGMRSDTESALLNGLFDCANLFPRDLRKSILKADQNTLMTLLHSMCILTFRMGSHVIVNYTYILSKSFCISLEATVQHKDYNRPICA